MAQTEPHPMDEHVIGQIGIHAVEPPDPCGTGMHLHLSPAVMEDDGHVDFGVLGVFLDMASSQAGEMRPFVHTDISVHRIAKPTGTKLLVDAVAAREGKSSSVVHIDVHDDLGTRIAYSCQSIRYMGPPRAEHADETSDAMRRRFLERFDGNCTLPGRLHDIVGLERDDAAGSPVWRMPLGPSSRNGFGGLHGGVAFSLVGEAAAGGATAAVGPAKTTSALLRYLAPGQVGPVPGRARRDAPGRRRRLRARRGLRRGRGRPPDHPRRGPRGGRLHAAVRPADRAGGQSMTTMMSPVATEDPSSTLSLETVPALSAVMLFSIFIASSTQST